MDMEEMKVTRFPKDFLWEALQRLIRLKVDGKKMEKV